MKRYPAAFSPLLGLLAALFLVSSSPAPGAVRGSDTVLVVPALPAVLKLAFDLENMRDITLVSVRAPSAPTRGIALKKPIAAESAEPLIHVWTGREWQYVPFNDFSSMAFIEKTPKTVIVIGDDQMAPQALLQNMNWPCKIERLPTINPADLLNGLNPYFDFSSREWKRLAEANALQLEDVNAAKRSFNPYNVPRSKMPLEKKEYKQEKGDPPPAVLIEQPDSQPAKQADKTSERPWIK